ncbi:MAG: AraC family transcriptional regulator [Ginsengibacter sp.]
MNNLENTLLELNEYSNLSKDAAISYQKSQAIPGTVHYVIQRYQSKPSVFTEDKGLFIYNYHPQKKNASVELVFCITGNKYCTHKETDCEHCINSGTNGKEVEESYDVIGFKFSARHLSTFVKGLKTTSFSEDILGFRHASSFKKSIPVFKKTRDVLQSMINHTYTDTLENIFINAQSQILLLYSMDMVSGTTETGFECKFLANEADREKIALAREILLEHICNPLTIKELSRKAAINECYLKKGFKEMYGTTIFDFFQNQRMEHAKYLLYEKNLTVTEVADLLEYSSISHFSTAFKKHTGLKPCELLFRNF